MNRFTLALFALAVGGVLSAHAQTPAGSAPTAGDFMLYNVEAQQYVTAGETWGTHTTLSTHGFYLTLAANDDGFTLSTNSTFPNCYIGANGYADNSSAATWTFTLVEGQSNTYTLKNGDNYLVYNSTGVGDGYVDSDAARVTRTTTAPTTSAGWWKLVSKEDFEKNVLSQATESNPVDASSYLTNPDFLKDNNTIVNGYSGTGFGAIGGYHTSAGANLAAEHYNKVFESYQTVTVPNGRYRVSANGFYSTDGNTSNPAYVFGNDTKKAFASQSEGDGSSKFSGYSTTDKWGTVNNISDDLAKAAHAFAEGYYLTTTDAFDITNNTLKAGVTSNGLTCLWMPFDNLKIEYLGSNLVNDAVALPSNGSMEAGKWYYVDIPMAGDDYNAKADNLDNIVYTIDGTILTADATTSVTTTFKATGNSLTATRYYVKSTTAQTLAIAPASYTYVAGTATADVAYIQAGNTVTVTYSGFETNDLSATLTKDFSGVTFGGETITTTATDNGFTFTVPTTVEANKEYTLSIPAKAIGYEAGSTYNAAQEITLKTPAILNGVYYLYNNAAKKYLSRGSTWGTRAVVDDYGVPVTVTMADASNGAFTLSGVDNSAYYGDDGWMYADCSDTRSRKYTAMAVTGGYQLTNTTNSKLVYTYMTNDGNQYYVAGDGVTGSNVTEASMAVWQFVSVTNHNTAVAAYPTTNKSNVISAAGISTTAGEFETYLSNNYGATDKTSLISAVASSSAIGTGWTWAGTDRNYGGYPAYNDPYARLYATTGTYTYTVSKDNLPGAGIYKVKVAGFDRRTGTLDGDKAIYETYGNIGASYLDANSQRVRIKSIAEVQGTYADTWDGQAEALTAGNGDVEVYVYLDGNTDLKLTVEKPDYNPGGSYFVFGNVQLTYYEAKATEADKTALSEAITAAEKNTLGFEAGEYAPYNNVDAIKALAAAKAINTETASSAEVTAATSAINNATWTANESDVDIVYNGNFATVEDDANYPKGWTRSNAWGQMRTDSDPNSTSKGTSYYNQPGSLVYGGRTGYTMPLKANTVYKLTFKYASWESNSNNAMSASVLNASNEGLASTSFDANGTVHTAKNAFKTATACFTTGTAGDYTLTLTNDGNTVMTDVSIVKVDAVTLSDDNSSDIASSEYADVTLERKFAQGWNSLVLPFETTTEKLGAAEAAEYKGTDGTTINFSTVTTLAANTPYIVYFDAATTESKVFKGVAVAPSESLTVTDGAGQYNFVGTYKAYTTGSPIGEGDYYVVSDGIQRAAGGNTIKAFRAYFAAQSTTSAAKRMVLSIDGDVVTAIDGVSVDSLADDDAPAYNLAGQRVGKSYKGVVVKNGKKLIRK